MTNKLYYGDNLDILQKHIARESVDLIYLDPPFNSNRSYNVLFKDESGLDSAAQIKAFEDTWHWDASARDTYDALIHDAPDRVATAISALRTIVGDNQMLAYLVMMTARLVELHRVLKPTGSLYLHCDPTASHYLKMILDTIFGAQNFRNEIIWKRTSAHNDQNITRYGAIHDIIFFYSKSNTWTFNKIYTEREENAPKTHDLYKHSDGNLYRKGDCTAPGGRGPKYEWNGHTRNWRFTQEEAKRLEAEGLIVYSKNGMPRVLRPVELTRGSQLQDMWTDIDPPNSGSSEILGYPTQKPVALLERIIAASSNPDDVVLDPFAGCGTTISAAQKLGRQWVGIDITHLSVSLLVYRLQDMFGLKKKADYVVIGEPEDVGGARSLAAEDRYQFQWWALSLVRAKPLGGDVGGKGKKGSDKGIDGALNFQEKGSKLGRVLVQVKSGKVKSGYVRDLVGTMDREKAAVGVFITLEEATSDMRKEAASAGVYRSETWDKNYPRIQILTIADLLSGKEIDMPPRLSMFKQAERVQAEVDAPPRLPGLG